MAAAFASAQAVEDAPKDSTSISPAAAIEAISASESQIANIEWHVSVVEGELDAEGTNWSMTNEAPVRFDGFVRIDCRSDRFLAEYETIQFIQSEDAPKGPRQLLKLSGASSFDSSIYRQWTRSNVAGQPERPYGSGLIAADTSELRDASFESAYGVTSGLYWMPPSFFFDPGAAKRTLSLSGFLQQKLSSQRAVEVTQTADGHWKIVTLASEVPGRYPVSVEISWDVIKGAIDEVVWFYAMPEKREILQHAKYSLQEVGSLWIPAEVFFVEFNTTNHRAVRWTFENVVVNRHLTNSDFIATFPPDIHLTDYITKKHYLTGADVLDEQAAARDFVTRTGLKGNDLAIDGDGEGHAIRWILAINAIAILVIVIIAVAIKRRRGRAIFVLSLIAVIPAKTSFGADPAATSTPSDSGRGSSISHSSGESIVVTRCGLRATLFALEYFGREYDPLHVDQALVPFWDGIRLSDIVDVLQGHGLTISSRKGVSLAEVGEAVTRRRLAIIPVRVADDWNHYYIVVRDEKGHVFVVDPPHAAYPFAKALRPEALEPTGGVVAFIEPAKDKRKVDRESLSITPTTIDFGTFVTDVAGPSKKARFHLTNNSSSLPVLVRDVRGSCGCMRSNWNGGLLRPSESKEVELDLMTTGWAAGRQTKQLLIKLADGSETSVNVVGTGVTAEEAHGVTVTPRRLNVTPGGGKTQRPNKPKQILVSGGDAALERLKVTAPDGGLRVQTVRRKGTVEILVSCSDDDTLVEAPAPASSTLRRLLITASEDYAPIEVEVYIRQQPSFMAVPKVVTVREAQTQPATVTIVPSPEAAAHVSVAAIEDITAIPPGITVSEDAVREGSRSLQVSVPPGPVEAGVFTVTCRLQTNSGTREAVSFVVRVEP